jgi:hypothetical protein
MAAADWGQPGYSGEFPLSTTVILGQLGVSWDFPGSRCPKILSRALICKGSPNLTSKTPPSPIAALADEKPATLMAQIRAVWPDIERALQIGHTLRAIHQRLNQAGIPITYRRLTVYRGRIQREKSSEGSITESVHTRPLTARNETVPERVSKAFDPLANLREQEKKRVDWKYPSGPPDESKLF